MTPEAKERYIDLAREQPDMLCSEAPAEVLEDASLVGEPTEFHEAYFAAGYTSWLEHKLGRRVKVSQQQLNNAVVVLWNRACELHTSRILGRPDERWRARFFSDEGLYG
ncbi:MAG: hypothetical protein J4F43_07805 [Dehalococcoidia bacterium]|nr:hypothetical protein [Dehalococcoidia bacterium]